MPAGTVLDYSGWRPTWQQYTQMRADGIVGVVRYPYLGPGTEWKAMQKAEYDLTLSFGFSVAFTPELNSDTWRGGYLKGVDVGKKARDWVRSLGFPDSKCMHFAVDTNVTPGEVSLAVAYLRGCSDGGGVGPQSCYGESSVIDAAFEQGVTCNGWRAAATAWDTNPSRHASMRQTTQHSYPYAGSYDENIITSPNWGQHPYSGDKMALPFELWQDGNIIWRVAADGQAKTKVPDLAQIAFNFNTLKRFGATDAECVVRNVTSFDGAKTWLDAITVSGAVVLPPLPPYPAVDPAPIAAATGVVVKSLLNQQKIVVP